MNTALELFVEEKLGIDDVSATNTEDCCAIETWISRPRLREKLTVCV
jgi:hypothetical protein